MRWDEEVLCGARLNLSTFHPILHSQQLQVLHLLRSPCADSIACGAALGACGKDASWLAAAQLLVDGQSQLLEKHCIMYNAMVTACERGLAWPLALQLLPDLAVASVEISDVTYNAAISACEKGVSAASIASCCYEELTSKTTASLKRL
ncbi:rsmF [Symbiodinium sp. KB8]|nr:rsmF [Symbiodinium sp. KB8]